MRIFNNLFVCTFCVYVGSIHYFDEWLTIKLTYGQGTDEVVGVIELPALTLHLHTRHTSPLTHALNAATPKGSRKQ